MTVLIICCHLLKKLQKVLVLRTRLAMTIRFFQVDVTLRKLSAKLSQLSIAKPNCKTFKKALRHLMTKQMSYKNQRKAVIKIGLNVYF